MEASNAGSKFIDKDTLTNVYGEDISSIIDSISSFKVNSINYFKEISDELSQKYDEFNSEIIKHINSDSSKIITAFNLNENENEKKKKLLVINKYTKDKINIYNEIITLHSQIFDIIKKNINILSNFLDIYKLLHLKKPVIEFISKEFSNILNSWLFRKLDLNKFHYEKFLDKKINNDFVTNLDKHYIDFITKQCVFKNKEMNFDFHDAKNEKSLKKYGSLDNKLINDNRNYLVKLKMKNTQHLDEFMKKNKLDKLEKLLLRNIHTKNMNILEQFPNLKKLKIQNCSTFTEKILSSINQINLTELYLENCGIINQEFNDIISDYFISLPEIRNNLVILSFAENNLTKINFNQHILLPKDSFLSLKCLFFNKNKIHKFVINQDYFPKLKIIDCCNNNLTSNYFDDTKKISDNVLILQSANYFLLDSDLYIDYYSKLQKKLSSIKIDDNLLKKLNLSYIPTAYSNTFFKEMKINYNLLIYLKELNLSYNGLTSDILLTFLENNKECLKLKILNLIGNNLDDAFFEIYLNKNLNDIFSNLQNLFLDDNNFGDDKIDIPNFINNNNDPISPDIKEEKKIKIIYKLRLFYKFILENKNLKYLTITKNPMSEKAKMLDEIQEGINNGMECIIKDKDGKIIINGFYSFLIKINEEFNKKKKEYGNKEVVVLFDCIGDIRQNSLEYANKEKGRPIVFT